MDYSLVNMLNFQTRFSIKHETFLKRLTVINLWLFVHWKKYYFDPDKYVIEFQLVYTVIKK